MNIKKFLIGAISGALMLGATISPTLAVAPWNVTGVYEITFFLNPDLSVTPYVHHAELTQSGTTVTGAGGYPATGGDVYHWNITSGTQSGDSLNLTAAYDLGAPGTTMHMVGTIAANGTISGTWDDDFGGPRTGTWSMTKGVSVPRINTPASGSTVSQIALVKVDWTDSVGSNPPFLYRYEAFSDSGYSALVYDSGMILTASEIPTPGTPPGDYYIRVMAQNDAGTQSVWSNGASDPYHIIVVLNTVPVPTECNQSISYNLIEGTNGSDILNGTSGPDLILAKDGSDVVNGKAGNDCIAGGAGSNVLKGDDGNDVILGGDGSDSIIGGNGNDKLYGGGGSDALTGNAGNDSLWGGDGADSLQGGADVDSANGGAGSDACSAETLVQCNP